MNQNMLNPCNTRVMIGKTGASCKRCGSILTDDGWETFGEVSIPFIKVKAALESVLNFHQYTPKDMWATDDVECYYSYSDESSIIEVQIGSGVKNEEVYEISVRFAVCNPVGTFEKTLEICRRLALKLDMNVLDMKLHEVLDFGNELQLMKSKKKFEEKKEKFISTFDLPIGTISKPLNCAEVFDVLKGK
ncbi:hypothetical protein RB620_29685 [Paenibacillus sp. LHD-117]|uniref:hypothetical protein n=1 Tax=Paenibacillus sp. LHD-117 TaxID=3071412 RepID=UPI0027E04592|nr:hypothetical protein [Paenibacillus sp. LHD-117]MDQ6423589.1 hypothetical protein [Paenibacillus sp. LHD-117]